MTPAPLELLARAVAGLPVAVYAGDVVEVHDGDTFTADVRVPAFCYGADRALGFGLAIRGRGLWLRTRIRLAGVNAAELGTPGGDAAAAVVAGLLPAGTTVALEQVRPDNFGGRWDAQVVLRDGRNLSTLLVATGWAAPWGGHGPRPVPPWPRPAGVRDV